MCRGPLAGARLLLCTLAWDLHAHGARTLASVLEAQGAEVWMAWLPEHGDREGPWKAELAERACEFDVVGFSVLSVDVPRATALARFLKPRIRGVLVWGGPWPTLHPGDVPHDVDVVGRGDGEGLLADLLRDRLENRRPPKGSILGRQATAEEMGAVPRVGFERTWVLHEGILRPATAAHLREAMARSPASRDTGTLAFETVTSRGCPHACTFCASTALGALGPKLRFRPLESVFEEIRRAREVLPFITGVGFADDNFLARPVGEIETFAERWKAEVKLPFIAIASPATATRERLAPLVDAGLRRLKMGLQTGSSRTAATLGRTSLSARIPEALEVVASFQDRLLPTRYDLMVDLPFETLEDRLETVRLVARLPRPFRIELNSLRLMEGTVLFEQARREGWSTPMNTVDFKRIQPSYTNLLLALSRNNRLSGPILSALAHPAAARAFSTGPGGRLLETGWKAARWGRRAVA